MAIHTTYPRPDDNLPEVPQMAYCGFGEAMPGLDWFEAGEAVFRTDTTDPRFFPPLDDAHAQRIWLGGFGAAWADWGAKCPGARPTEALWDAIYRRLGDRRELIDCLQRVNRCGWYEAQ